MRHRRGDYLGASTAEESRISSGLGVETRTSIRLKEKPARELRLRTYIFVPSLLNDRQLCYYQLNTITADFLSWSLLSHPLSPSRLQLRVSSVRRIPRRP